MSALEYNLKSPKNPKTVRAIFFFQTNVIPCHPSLTSFIEKDQAEDGEIEVFERKKSMKIHIGHCI